MGEEKINYLGNEFSMRKSVYQCAYLLPMGWPCIYSRCCTSWMVTRIHSHWIGYFLLLLVSDLVGDIERTVYLR